MKKKIKKWSADKYPKSTLKKNDPVHNDFMDYLGGKLPKRYYINLNAVEPAIAKYMTDDSGIMAVMYYAKNMAETELPIADGEYYDLCVGPCYGNECVFRFCTKKSEKTMDLLDDVFINARYMKNRFGIEWNRTMELAQVMISIMMENGYTSLRMNGPMFEQSDIMLTA